MKHLMIGLTLMIATVSAHAKFEIPVKGYGESSSFHKSEGKSEINKASFDTAHEQAMGQMIQECQYMGQKLQFESQLTLKNEVMKEIQDEYETLYRTTVSLEGICSEL